jgi:hypothetical protein
MKLKDEPLTTLMIGQRGLPSTVLTVAYVIPPAESFLILTVAVPKVFGVVEISAPAAAGVFLTSV